MATITCGWCNTICHATPTGVVAVTRLMSYGEDRYVADASYKCDGCGRLSVVSWETSFDPHDTRWQSYGRSGEPEDYDRAAWHPVPGTQMRFPDVPEEIASAAAEAWTCHAACADRGAVALARAVVESTAKAKGITVSGIASKIDEMAEQGLIRPAVADQAHEIRHMGNGAAHGDLGDPVTAEDAEEVLHLMGEVLNEVWQSPAKAARLASARRAKKQP